MNDTFHFAETIVRNAGKLRLMDGQNLFCYGSWSNAATFIAAGNSTVVFAGPAEATVRGHNTWANLIITNAAKTVRFESGKIQTINGTPVFDNGVTLRSIVNGERWKLIVPIDGEDTTQPVGQVNARDSDASDGRTFLPQGGQDLGNNLNWEWPPAGSIFTFR